MPKKDSHQGHLVAIKRRDVLNAREAHLLRVLQYTNFCQQKQ